MEKFEGQFVMLRLDDLRNILQDVLTETLTDIVKNEEKVYTIKEAAVFLKIHDRTLRRYLDKGLVQCSKRGSKYLIKHKDLMNFIENQNEKFRGVYN